MTVEHISVCAGCILTDKKVPVQTASRMAYRVRLDISRGPNGLSSDTADALPRSRGSVSDIVWENCLPKGSLGEPKASSLQNCAELG
jgi:hypothetical protein